MESLFKRINPVRRLRWSKRARLSNGVKRILSLREQGRKRKSSQGVTLIELMIALGLSTVVAGAIIGIMSTGTRIWKMSTTQLTAFQSEQVMLDRMKKELEEASKIYGAEWGSIAFYRQGYSITPLSSPLAAGLTSDDPYSDNWKGKLYDIVWYYTGTVGGKGAVFRKVTDGYTPSIVVSNPVIISDPNTDIKRLKFLYFNYGNYLTWLERTTPPPPPLDLYSPGVRPPPYKKVIDTNISPYYPQNIFLGNEIAWVKGTLGDDVKLQSRSCTPSAVWWDDEGTALSGDGSKSWTALSTDLVKSNPWSGKKAIKLSDGLPDEPAGGTASLALTKSVPAGSDTLLKTTAAGSMSLTTQPAAATQLEITLGAKTNVIVIEGENKLEVSEGSGKIIISGTTVEVGAGDSETLETSACGVPFTTTKRFSNVTGITTSGLTDEKFSDNTSAVPDITIVDPNKKVWIFTHVLLGTSYSTPKVVLLQFKKSSDGTWKGAYWSESRQEPALDKSEDAVNFGLIPKMDDGTRGVDGVNRVYMGPLPEPGGWTVLGVPAAAAGVSLEGASISNVALTIYNGLAYFDKAEVGTFSGWYGVGGAGGVYSNAGGEAITSPNAQFIQYKAIFASTVSNPNPVMSESSLEHGCGGNRWIVTSSADSPGNDRWKAGSLNNVIAGEGDIKLFQWNINYGIDGTLQSYDMSGWAQRYMFTLPKRRFVRDKVLLEIDSADAFEASSIRVALLKEDNVNLQLVPFEQVPPTGSSTSHKIYVLSTNGEAAGGGTVGSVNWSTSGGRLYVYYAGSGGTSPGPAYTNTDFNTAFGTSVHYNTTGQHPFDTCYLPVSVTGTIQIKANYGTYLSQPYCAPAHSIWTLPYTADAYDVRVHFTHFNTQTADTLGIYNVNSCTGLPAAGALIQELYGAGATTPTSGWLKADTSGAIMKGTGYRTPWLLAGNDGESPNPIPPSEILLAGGAKFSFIFTAPLGYNLTCDDGWMIDRYECWTAMNPTLIQIDLTAQAGKGRNERAKTLSTKAQPSNLLYK